METKLCRHILIVEDHVQTAGIMARMVRARGFSVVTATTLAEARACAAAGEIGFLISDLGLIDGTGWQLMVELKARWNINGVAVSGFGMEGDVERSRQAGFLLHLIKPIDLSVLNRILDLARQGLVMPPPTA